MAQGHGDAEALLLRLLDRHEAQGRRDGAARRLTEKVAQSFARPELGDSFLRQIVAAERAGAVTLLRGKGETAHLIERVALRDAERLYAHLGRAPLGDRLAAAARGLDRIVAAVAPAQRPFAAAEAARFLAAWSEGKARFRHGLAAPEGCHDFLRAFAAVAARRAGDPRDLRSFSRQECGDSKLIERYLPDLRSAARQAGQVPAEVRDDALDRLLGLEKFPHLVTLAGPLPALGAAAGRAVPGALHPELIAALDPVEIADLVTIENYASFNRYIREAMGPRDVVLYTGGWPGRGERALIAALAPRARRVFHWGDIDMAGAGIADAVWQAAGREIALHLMTPEIARAAGAIRKGPAPTPLQVADASPAKPLILWLASPAGAELEQEELDPLRPPE